MQTNQSNLDGDSRGDWCDNCIQVANNDQADSDADGWGNVCDNCPNISNWQQYDLDGDGLGDACDSFLNWQKTYPGRQGRFCQSIIQTFESKYVICGSIVDSIRADQLNLMKIDKFGTVIWDRVFGGTTIEIGRSVIQTSDSGFAAVGYTINNLTNPPNWDMYLVKTDKMGTFPTFIGTYGGPGLEVGESVVQTNDGGFLIAGSTSSYGAGGSDIYLVKTDNVGVIQWSKTFGGVGGESATSIRLIESGGFILAGVTNSFGAGSNDMYLIKLNNSGDSVWSKTYGYSGNEGPNEVQRTNDGGYLLAGSTESVGSGLRDMFLVRVDSIGNIIWSKTYGGTNYEDAYSIKVLPDRGFVVAGYTTSFGSGGMDFYVLRSYYTGDTIWTKTYHDSNEDKGYSIDLTSDGGYIVAGVSWDWPISPAEGFVVKDGPLEAISCCLDTTGNVNFDLNDLCSILDLNYLINKLFRGGPAPPCPEESDLDGDGVNGNILDMNFLVNSFFRGGPKPSHLCDPSKKLKEQLSNDFFVELK